MLLKLTLGMTEESVEQALPALERAGLRLVRQAAAPESDGEVREYYLDIRQGESLDVDAFETALSRAKAAIEKSLVPGWTAELVAG